tara:strand:- start:1440 stop:1748 length:309 start_codon:yes stop_codon:yes gene_type:complete
MIFDAPNWIFVGDMEECPHSKRQVEVCKQLGLNIKGAVLCNEPEQAQSDACTKVPAFPCFCNVASNVCVAGLRTLPSQFDDLQRISDTELRKNKVAENKNPT